AVAIVWSWSLRRGRGHPPLLPSPLLGSFVVVHGLCAVYASSAAAAAVTVCLSWSWSSPPSCRRHSHSTTAVVALVAACGLC
ncbi:hypothetical protein EDB89DRAFT_1966385, partial [Lactarius sanguifluus]